MAVGEKAGEGVWKEGLGVQLGQAGVFTLLVIGREVDGGGGVLKF